MDGRRVDFDRDDPEYKALYDQMVLEEMEKMEQYFQESMEFDETERARHRPGAPPPPLTLGQDISQAYTARDDRQSTKVAGLHRNDGNWLDEVQLPKRNIVSKPKDPEPENDIFRSMGTGRVNDRCPTYALYHYFLASI